ncbi:uncharacterized protein STEHIDRAFT_133980 [Stereum hirsutum FP-91666 SS1]|uniref:uncharacterized protein n=1 Tax=Stereum hirsutum (strain FP-91666) TaxID=721885 RepID=UPI0004449D1B|nr:uncharacterized protein STEHIDRAFT_133980 [Stereum hirsutum FP-91666 SS1]EIM82356.1 hypothetical protein STEHIDRAFT_133980 [Stereum hirsutum FP-91666 SS1]
MVLEEDNLQDGYIFGQFTASASMPTGVYPTLNSVSINQLTSILRKLSFPRLCWRSGFSRLNLRPWSLLYKVRFQLEPQERCIGDKTYD